MTPPDVCPKCGIELPSPSEPCSHCGSQAPVESAAPEPQPVKEAAGITGLIEMDYSVASEDDKPEIPQWRLELSQRFQEIKSRRETGVPPAAEKTAESTPEPAPVKENAARPNDATDPEPLVVPPQPRRPKPARPVSRPEIRVNQAAEVSPMPLFEARPPAPPVQNPAPSDTIQEMIDRAVAKRAPAAVPVPAPAPAQAPVAAASPQPEPLAAESRLILLSRTLSGLVDLIIVVFCAAALVIAADTVSGIETLDGRSLVHYSALLLATFFLYSIFFLFTGNQTIGMMITDLCVVELGDVRPEMARIVGRCALYLVSLLGAGIGLLWGCFDKEACCLHDRYSGTRIVRLSR